MRLNSFQKSGTYEHLQQRGIVRQHQGRGTFVRRDAIDHVQQRNRRRFDTLYIAFGEPSLERGRRETLFITIDILKGVRDVLGQREPHFAFVESLTPACLEGLTHNDAVMLRNAKEIDPAFLKDIQKRNVPVVTAWNQDREAGAPRVGYDQRQAVTVACKHLAACGYKRIGFIGRKRALDTPARKFQAFMDCLHELNLDVYARYAREALKVPGSGYAAARQLIETGNLPDALFIDTDFKAMEVVHAFNDAGIRVPEDVAIVAYDDVPEAAAFTPALTTVRTPRQAVGRRAAQMMVDWPDDGSKPQDVLLPAELIVRDSCGASA